MLVLIGFCVHLFASHYLAAINFQTYGIDSMEPRQLEILDLLSKSLLDCMSEYSHKLDLE